MRGEVGWVGVVLALAGVAQLASGRAQGASRRDRRALLALTGLTYITTVAFNLVYTIGDIFVMYTSSYLMVVLWLVVGVGTGGAQPGVGGWWPRPYTVAFLLWGGSSSSWL